MADYFTHFSCLLDVGTPDKAARALALFQELRAADQDAVDHERFFEVIDSPPMPTEALRSAFRRAKTRSVQRDTGPATTD